MSTSTPPAPTAQTSPDAEQGPTIGDSAMSSVAGTSQSDASGPLGRRLAGFAGIAYLLAWCVGLAVFSSSTDVSSSGREVLHGLAGHTAAASLQYLLTEIVTGVALALVVAGLLGRLPSGRARSVFGVAGGAASAISIAQGIVGIWMCETFVGRSDATVVGEVTTALNRADGAKMLVLAITVAALLVAAVRFNTPSWFRVVAIVAVPALVVSGLGYLTAVGALAVAAWISLPLLIVTVAGSASTIGRLTIGRSA